MAGRSDHVVELVRNGGLTRRQFARLLAGLGVVAVAMRKGQGPALAASEQPTFFTWATMDVPGSFRATSKSTESRRNLPSSAIKDEAILKVRGGFKPDVVYPQSIRSAVGTMPGSWSRWIRPS